MRFRAVATTDSQLHQPLVSFNLKGRKAFDRLPKLSVAIRRFVGNFVLVLMSLYLVCEQGLCVIRFLHF